MTRLTTTGWVCLWFGLLTWPAWGQNPPRSEQLDSGKAHKQCEQGVTIYCLALGMAEARNGRNEEALEHFRLACRHHPTTGPLLACTPMLSLARDLGRLEELAAPLEAQCAAGEVSVCYYLGKEYLKINEPERANVHLEPLCREGYHPPDPKDYGPCYHLGRAYQGRGDFGTARRFFEEECGPESRPEHPLCQALAQLETAQDEAEQRAWERIGNFGRAEVVLAGLVMVCVGSAAGWLFGGIRWRWWFRWGLPALVLAGALVWWRAPKQFDYYPGDLVVILLLTGTVSVLAWVSRKTPPSDAGEGS